MRKLKFVQPKSHRALLWIAGLLGLMCSMPARADLIVSFQAPISAVAGTNNNSFDVFLTNQDPLNSLNIAGFDFEIISASTDVTFTDATTSVANYIFSGNSFVDSIPGADLAVSNSGTDLIANDFTFTPNSEITLLGGQTVGLGHILFNVSPGATTESITLTFGAFTDFSDANGNPVNLAASSAGNIDITGAPATVPEPSTIVSFGLGLLSFLPSIRRRSAPYMSESRR